MLKYIDASKVSHSSISLTIEICESCRSTVINLAFVILPSIFVYPHMSECVGVCTREREWVGVCVRERECVGV